MDGYRPLRLIWTVLLVGSGLLSDSSRHRRSATHKGPPFDLTETEIGNIEIGEAVWGALHKIKSLRTIVWSAGYPR